MQIVKQGSVGQQEAVAQMVRVLEEGGLVCLPCNGTYRILADLTNADAVMRLFQSKRRVHKAPSLVFVDSVARLKKVVDGVEDSAQNVMDLFWPGPVTILFDASEKLPRKVIKELTKANGGLGVRIPDDEFAREVVGAFGGAVLVSSANRGKKGGETSPAQIRQNFVGRVDYFYDAGDLRPDASSTVIRISKTGMEVVRAGAVSEEDLQAAMS